MKIYGKTYVPARRTQSLCAPPTQLQRQRALLGQHFTFAQRLQTPELLCMTTSENGLRHLQETAGMGTVGSQHYVQCVSRGHTAAAYGAFPAPVSEVLPEPVLHSLLCSSGRLTFLSRFLALGLMNFCPRG